MLFVLVGWFGEGIKSGEILFLTGWSVLSDHDRKDRKK